jgi:hypothetical protein
MLCLTASIPALIKAGTSDDKNSQMTRDKAEKSQIRRVHQSWSERCEIDDLPLDEEQVAEIKVGEAIWRAHQNELDCRIKIAASLKAHNTPVAVLLDLLNNLVRVAEPAGDRLLPNQRDTSYISRIVEGFSDDGYGREWQELTTGEKQPIADSDLNIAHWCTLLDPNTSEEQKMASLDHLAALAWPNKISSKNPSAKLVIHNLRGRFVLENLIASCAFSAILDSHDKQNVRLGQRWVTGEDGKKRPVIPSELNRTEYQMWLLQKSRKYFEHRMLEENDEDEEYEQHNHLNFETNNNNSVENDLIGLLDEKKNRIMIQEKMNSVLSLLSAQQQEYMEHKMSLLEANPEITERALLALVCKNMGINRKHANQLDLQIRKKIWHLKTPNK